MQFLSRSFPTRGFLLSLLFRAGDEQENSAGKRQASEDRRNGNVFVRIFGGVDGPDIEDISVARVVDSLVSENQGAQDDK